MKYIPNRERWIQEINYRCNHVNLQKGSRQNYQQSKCRWKEKNRKWRSSQPNACEWVT